MVDQSRALADQPVAGPMKRLQVLLVLDFTGTKRIVGRIAASEDRLRVDRIVLRAFDEGLYETRC